MDARQTRGEGVGDETGAASMSVVVDDALALIGRTPLIRLGFLERPGGASMWAKAEHMNPGGSVKDRPCLRMIEEAESQGLLAPGACVVEPTSGNTGIGLALVCATRGYRLILTMPESMSLERRALLEAYGAEIVLTPAEETMQGAVDEAKRIAAERGAFMPQQFSNPANPKVHAEDTATEIWEALAQLDSDQHEVMPQMDAQQDVSQTRVSEQGERALPLHAFVAAVGTGGTVTGVGRALKARSPSIRVVAIEPENSPVLTGGKPGPTKLQGIGAGFVPAVYEAKYVDDVVQVSDADAYTMKQRLAREAGLLVGITAGANVHVAAVMAAQMEPWQRVVTVLCDTGERYFSLDTYFQGDASEQDA